MAKKLRLNPIYKGGKTTKLWILPFNRAIGQQHAREIGQSIQDHGWVGTLKCVETTLYSKAPRRYIVDGQHSHTGAIMVNSDYRFEVKKVKTQEEIIKLMADLNNNSKGWFLHDYLRVWAYHGLASYKYMKDIFESTKLPLAPLISIYSSSVFGSGGRTTKKFKVGSLVLKNKKKADEIVTELKLMRPILKNIKDNFIIAFADVYIMGKYNRKKFLTNLQKNKAVVKQLTTIPDIKEVLKKII